MKSKPSAAYAHYDVETHRTSANSVRVRPVAGQGLPTSMNVECPNSMRDQYPVGTVFRIKAQVIENSTGARHLYTHYRWPFVVIAKPDRSMHHLSDGAQPATTRRI